MLIAKGDDNCFMNLKKKRPSEICPKKIIIIIKYPGEVFFFLLLFGGGGVGCSL